jgi:hypothetical protein
VSDEESVKTDSIDVGAHKMLQFCTHVIDCVQYFVSDISYMDSQSAILRILRKLGNSHSFVYTQMQLKCVLRTLANRRGAIKVSSQSQMDILKILLKFHLQQYDVHSHLIIDMIHLCIQNLLLFSSWEPIPDIGFNELHWAAIRIQQFLQQNITFINTNTNTNTNNANTSQKHAQNSATITTTHSRSRSSVNLLVDKDMIDGGSSDVDTASTMMVDDGSRSHSRSRSRSRKQNLMMSNNVLVLNGGHGNGNGYGNSNSTIVTSASLVASTHTTFAIHRGRPLRRHYQ